MFFRVGGVEYLVGEYVLSEHLIFNMWVIIGNLTIDQTDAVSYIFQLGEVEYLIREREYVLSEHLIFNLWVIIVIQQ